MKLIRLKPTLAALFSDREELRTEISSRIWCTYRKNFPMISDAARAADTSWGCMHRAGQMVLAQALINLHLGRSQFQFAPVSCPSRDDRLLLLLLQSGDGTPKGWIRLTLKFFACFKTKRARPTPFIKSVGRIEYLKNNNCNKWYIFSTHCSIHGCHRRSTNRRMVRAEYGGSSDQVSARSKAVPCRCGELCCALNQLLNNLYRNDLWLDDKACKIFMSFIVCYTVEPFKCVIPSAHKSEFHEFFLLL